MTFHKGLLYVYHCYGVFAKDASVMVGDDKAVFKGVY